ncbi:unnamed protein product [Cyprideis torosa]|uniref:Uncharacterized protein n=1 Tax=Cyprideis torosa TaxID=163714 RepID=A0A7R8WDZ0_9CRUS|nr:unnamed protein product [Cyprideis torosa]CAG0895238.1 unnamed protein product [Cyprideis torosa]
MTLVCVTNTSTVEISAFCRTEQNAWFTERSGRLKSLFVTATAPLKLSPTRGVSRISPWGGGHGHYFSDGGRGWYAAAAAAIRQHPLLFYPGGTHGAGTVGSGAHPNLAHAWCFPPALAAAFDHRHHPFFKHAAEDKEGKPAFPPVLGSESAVSMCKNSVVMERDGTKEVLTRAKEKLGLNITGIVTDRSLTVGKLIREQFPGIEHFYDVWHISKSIKKAVSDLTKTKGQLESFHALLLKYCDKRHHFQYPAMISRLQLAVMDHNENVGRPQKKSNEGDELFKVTCPKSTGVHKVVPVFEGKTYSFRDEVKNTALENLVKPGSVHAKAQAYSASIRSEYSIPKTVSKTTPPPKVDLIGMHRPILQLHQPGPASDATIGLKDL